MQHVHRIVRAHRRGSTVSASAPRYSEIGRPVSRPGPDPDPDPGPDRGPRPLHPFPHLALNVTPALTLAPSLTPYSHPKQACAGFIQDLLRVPPPDQPV